MGGLELRQSRQQPAQRYAGMGVDGQARQSVIVEQPVDLGVHLGQRRLVHLAQALAVHRQGHRAGQPVEEGKAQHFLQPGDAVAHRAGRQAEILGRRLEAEVTRGNDKGFDVDDVIVVAEDSRNAAGMLPGDRIVGVVHA